MAAAAANRRKDRKTMTEAARWNLQHGVPEDTRFEHTTYTAEDDFDRQLLHRMRIRQMINDDMRKRQEAALEKQLEKELEKKLEQQLEKVLDNLLKDFK